jgi:hypothetical protein
VLLPAAHVAHPAGPSSSPAVLAWTAASLDHVTGTSEFPSEEQAVADVFISYARDDDEPFAMRLHENLAAEGVTVWWDQTAMESRGRAFLQELRDAIAKAERLILVIGPRAVTSDYVRFEWTLALEACKVVVPVLRMGDFSLIPERLTLLHCLDFRAARSYEDALGELLRIIRTPVPPLAVLNGVETLPPKFLPRPREVDRLRTVVLADTFRPTAITSAGRTTALQGMGGIGKSVLAASFARSCETRRSFADGVIWITIGQESSPLQGLQLLGKALDDTDLQYYANLQESQFRLAGLLEHRNCLLVLDDVWSVAHVEAFMNVLGQRCRLLLTTRDGAVSAAIGAQEHRLDVLDTMEALTLLADWSEQAVPMLPTQAEMVAVECGNLPLALAMIGALVRGRPDRWENVLHKLRNADLERIGLQFPNYPYADLLRTIQVSVEALPPDVQPRYDEFSVFPADTAIPEAALAVLWETHGMSRYDTQDIVDLLVTRSLARRDEDGNLTLHDLQYDYVRKQIDDVVALHDRLLEGYGARCQDGWPTGPNDGYFFRYLAHHMAAAGRTQELADLVVDFDWLQAKLEATDVGALLSDFDVLPDNRGEGGNGGDRSSWKSFIREQAHLFTHRDTQWPPRRTLLQLAWEHAENSVVTRAAQEWLAQERCDWTWIRRRSRISSPTPQASLGSISVGGSVVDMAVDEDGGSAVIVTCHLDPLANSLTDWALVHLDLRGLRVVRREPHTLSPGQPLSEMLIGRSAKRIQVRSWDLHTTMERWERLAILAVDSVGFSNGELLAMADVRHEPVFIVGNDRLIAGGHDGVVRVWNADSLDQLANRPQEDDDAREAINRARRKWTMETFRDAYSSPAFKRYEEFFQPRFDPPLLAAHHATSFSWSSMNGGLQSIAFCFGSLYQLNLYATKDWRRLASWLSEAPLFHPEYDNMMADSNLVRAAATDGGLAVETASGVALLLEVVRGTEVVDLQRLDELVRAGTNPLRYSE